MQKLRNKGSVKYGYKQKKLFTISNTKLRHNKRQQQNADDFFTIQYFRKSSLKLSQPNGILKKTKRLFLDVQGRKSRKASKSKFVNIATMNHIETKWLFFAPCKHLQDMQQPVLNIRRPRKSLIFLSKGYTQLSFFIVAISMRKNKQSTIRTNSKFQMVQKLPFAILRKTGRSSAFCCRHF